jgi:hypothetical protein
MQAGQIENYATNGVMGTISSSLTDHVTTVAIQVVSSAGFDGTLTFKKRLNRTNRPNDTQNLTTTACAYEKQSDKTIGTAAIAVGASSNAVYHVDVTAAELLPEISGRTAGSVSIYWTVVLG